MKKERLCWWEENIYIYIYIYMYIYGLKQNLNRGLSETGWI